jgi:hypothetical protein
MGLGSGIRDPEKNLYRIPDPDPQHCQILRGSSSGWLKRQSPPKFYIRGLSLTGNRRRLTYSNHGLYAVFLMNGYEGAIKHRFNVGCIPTDNRGRPKMILRDHSSEP